MKIPTASPSLPKEPLRPISELLSDPEALSKLPLEELTKLLAPYIPEVRKAVLPEEKPSKLGLGTRVVKDFISDPSIKAQLEALRKQMKK